MNSDSRSNLPELKTENGYTISELSSLYELGRMYYELGYFAPAERVFLGLIAIDQNLTPAKVGLGLVKLETGVIDDAITYFKEALEIERYKVSAKIGLAAAFVANREFPRARSILGQIDRDLQSPQVEVSTGMIKLWRSLTVRSEEN